VCSRCADLEQRLRTDTQADRAHQGQIGGAYGHSCPHRFVLAQTRLQHASRNPSRTGNRSEEFTTSGVTRPRRRGFRMGDKTRRNTSSIWICSNRSTEHTWTNRIVSLSLVFRLRSSPHIDARFSCELQSRKVTSKIIILVPLLNPSSQSDSRHGCANF